VECLQLTRRGADRYVVPDMNETMNVDCPKGTRAPGALLVAAALLLASGACLAAAGSEGADAPGGIEEGRRLLAAATDGFFDQSVDSPALRELLERSRSGFDGIQDRGLRLYWHAEVEYLLGFVEQAEERFEQAEERLEQGRDLIMESLRLGETSQAYRLLADTYAQLLILNGLLYKMSYGPKVREMAEEALRLDPGNVKARLTLALFYKNAPAIAGGSRRRSLSLLHMLEGEGTLERVDLFSVNAWLGIAYSESRNTAEARRYLQRALDVYPGNTWLRGMLSELPS